MGGEGTSFRAPFVFLRTQESRVTEGCARYPGLLRSQENGAFAILPRKGEVAPKVTEGEDTEPRFTLTSPSVWQVPATSPWRGRIASAWPSAQRQRVDDRGDGGEEEPLAGVGEVVVGDRGDVGLTVW